MKAFHRPAIPNSSPLAPLAISGFPTAPGSAHRRRSRRAGITARTHVRVLSAGERRRLIVEGSDAADRVRNRAARPPTPVLAAASTRVLWRWREAIRGAKAGFPCGGLGRWWCTGPGGVAAGRARTLRPGRRSRRPARCKKSLWTAPRPCRPRRCRCLLVTRYPQRLGCSALVG